jgi:capsid assembly protease
VIESARGQTCPRVDDGALAMLASTPLAMAPRYLGHMLAVLTGRQTPAAPRTPVLRGQHLTGTAIADRIAVVPIVGPIMHRADMFSQFGAVSVGEIRATIGAALDDDEIDAILLVVDSPGGEVAGVADLADALYAARGKKPMWAVADEGIFSAAYWIASAAGPVVLPRTGSVGSIGALVVHQDVSGALEQMGVKMTVVKSGAKKAMFSPFQPLSTDARDALQAEVDRVAGLFIGAVSQYRNVPAATIAGYEAGTFEGDAAVEAGLADWVNTVEGAFLALKMSLLRGDAAPRIERISTMADSLTPQPPAQGALSAPAPAAPRPLPESVNAPPAPAPGMFAQSTNITNIAEARRAGREEAQQSERRRAKEIMEWCAFAGRIDMAAEFTAGEMSVEQVRNELVNITAGLSFNEIHTNRGAGAVDQLSKKVASVEEIYNARRAAVAEARRQRFGW